MDYYTSYLGISEVDYWILVFGGISFGILGVTYSFLFRDVKETLEIIHQRREMEMSRYY
jgi:hypothetical protein